MVLSALKCMQLFVAPSLTAPLLARQSPTKHFINIYKYLCACVRAFGSWQPLNGGRSHGVPPNWRTAGWLADNTFRRQRQQRDRTLLPFTYTPTYIAGCWCVCVCCFLFAAYGALKCTMRGLIAPHIFRLRSAFSIFDFRLMISIF